MEKNVSFILKGFLSKVSQDEKKKLLECLSPQMQKAIDDVESPSFEIDSKKIFQNGLIDSVHYSWFIPLFNLYSPKESALLLKVLNPKTAASLKKVLKIQTDVSLTPLAKEFFKDFLLSSLIDKQATLLPLEFLPPSKLNQLLKLTKQQIVKLIDLLSLYELAFSLKKIVDTKLLNKINSYLSESEKSYLKKIKLSHTQIHFSKFNLEKMAEDQTFFKSTLHKGGILRLSIALSGESLDLIWYLCHYLDIGRGNILFKLCKKEKIKHASAAVANEILETLKIL
ncbi:MAG: hypothetical protein HZB76_05705 [Chlamydiae bacterium]|nr:hypothetical protein [Chlamydiota bacterium]